MTRKKVLLASISYFIIENTDVKSGDTDYTDCEALSVDVL